MTGIGDCAPNPMNRATVVDRRVPLTARTLRTRLRALARPRDAAILQRFFKTGKGEYGEGDVFIGVRLPELRMLCRECRGISVRQIIQLLRSRVHEERLLAVLLLVASFQRGDVAERRDIYNLYLANTAFINNWDLVDASAAHIVGAWLEDRSRAPFRRLARSSLVWERRIAIIATLHFIRRGEFEETFLIADRLLEDPHDLIHKAVGWMLREVGNRDIAALRCFLKDRYRRMPRTMLRYAIEKLPEKERLAYLKGTIA
jgi:3-methyladenine DNA glycosylase AlkD